MREHWMRLLAILIILVIGGLLIWWAPWKSGDDKAKPEKPAVVQSKMVKSEPTTTPLTFEEIVLEVDSAKFMESCLAAGGTEAECQATLGDLVKK